MGTETRKIRRQLMGARSPPRRSPMKVPLMAAAWLMPRAKPRRSGGKASVRMAAELAMSMAAPDPLEDAHDDEPDAAGGAGHPGDAQQQGEEGEDGEAEVVHADAPVEVAQAPEAHHQHAGDDEEAEDHPEQEEGVRRQERVEMDAAEDVGQGDEDDGGVDRRHEHAERRDEQRRPAVGVVGVGGRGAGRRRGSGGVGADEIGHVCAPFRRCASVAGSSSSLPTGPAARRAQPALVA